MVNKLFCLLSVLCLVLLITGCSSEPIPYSDEVVSFSCPLSDLESDLDDEVLPVSKYVSCYNMFAGAFTLVWTDQESDLEDLLSENVGTVRAISDNSPSLELSNQRSTSFNGYSGLSQTFQWKDGADKFQGSAVVFNCGGKDIQIIIFWDKEDYWFKDTVKEIEDSFSCHGEIPTNDVFDSSVCSSDSWDFEDCVREHAQTMQNVKKLRQNSLSSNV